MNVLVTIDGREAIPVRAIRFALHRKCDSSSQLADIGNPDSSIPIKRFAYHWNSRGKIQEVSLAYWKNLSFERRRLPAGVWMWLDEFEEAFNWSLRFVPPPIGLQLGPSGFSFDYDPPISKEEWAVVMEGFERFVPSATPLKPAQDTTEESSMEPETKQTDRRLRPVQQDRIDFQNLCKEFWKDSPQTPITGANSIVTLVIAKHPAYLSGGAHKHGQTQGTLEDWARKVAPEGVKNKRGRPRKISAD